MGLSHNEPQSTESQVTAGNHNPTLGQRANEILRGAQLDETGKVILPTDIPQELKEFVGLEKQRRDTQAAFTKGQQAIATLQAEKDALLSQVGTTQISAEDAERLEILKYEDPDRWYAEKQRLDTEAQAASQTRVNETLATAQKTAEQTFREQEMVRRQKILVDFTANSGLNLTEDIIKNDVPPRIQNKLNEGMEFGAWLYEVAEYLKAPKVVENERITNVTDIGAVGGAGNTADTSPQAYGSDTIY
ncbi:MAG: hypothetical protein DRQ98_13275 [Gammaproteobacteria bacterium]|nr:MAG: hypothetical protein DRQ98_13275 [Gammaproteobacteria bacterium]